MAPPLNSITVAAAGSVIVATTFLKHYTKKILPHEHDPASASVDGEEEDEDVGGSEDSKLKAQKVPARENSLLFDEAFTVVKDIFGKAINYTVEEVQSFGNMYVPAPFWVKLVHVTIPISTLSTADDYIVQALGGEEEAFKTCGGTKWWRARLGDGTVPGEWLAMKSDWKDSGSSNGSSSFAFPSFWSSMPQRHKHQKKKSEKEKSQPSMQYSEDMDSLPCMLYIHGGAYYFGSINTHRYQIWRYCRKMRGRAFAVTYRLAPQFPFPCALADAMASYLYLISPPPEAKHKPVPPNKIIIAGDSAGGGLSLALLCAIRDVGLPLPAGAVLISPWVDLTHSFPSILRNTATDIIPPYGFLHKPSLLWPPPPADYTPKVIRESKHLQSMYRDLVSSLKTSKAVVSASKKRPEGDTGASQPEVKAEDIIEIQVSGKMVQLNEQIQLYATNSQLTHPFVSPVLQPTLGGLPPTLIIAGNNEVLRDEIVYLAHRAADPDKYQLRRGLKSTKPVIVKPTKVHLQVYDDAPHVLPLFSFTKPAKYCYRSIASFCVWATSVGEASAVFTQEPVETEKEEQDQRIDSTMLSTSTTDIRAKRRLGDDFHVRHSSNIFDTDPTRSPSQISVQSFEASSASTPPRSHTDGSLPKRLDQTIYTPRLPLNRPDFKDNMIRERVSITGVIRPLEDISKITCLHIDPEEIGIIKEGPVKRYLEGKKDWDKKYKRTYLKIQKKRDYNIKRATREEFERVKQMITSRRHSLSAAGISQTAGTSTDTETESARDLIEHPPPSSIAARKDIREARLLAKVLEENKKTHGINTLALWTDIHDFGALKIPSSSNKDSALEPLKKVVTGAKADGRLYHGGQKPGADDE